MNDATDAFIKQTSSSAPRKNKASRTSDEEMRTTTNNVRQEWSSDIYSRLNSDDVKSDSPACGCSSIFVLSFSIALLLGGLALIVIGSIEKDHRLLPLCPKCTVIINALYGIGACNMAVGILGVVAAATRKKVLAIPYMVMVLLFAVVFLGLGIAVLVFQGGSIQLGSVWVDAVKNDPDLICSLQTKLQCSGYHNGCCNGPNTSSVQMMMQYPHHPLGALLLLSLEGNESYCYNRTSVPSWVATDCVPSCSSNMYTAVCEGALIKQIKDNLGPIVGAIFPFAVLLGVVGGLSLKMTLGAASARFYDS